MVRRGPCFVELNYIAGPRIISVHSGTPGGSPLYDDAIDGDTRKYIITDAVSHLWRSRDHGATRIVE
jgi:hypothetical protein